MQGTHLHEDSDQAGHKDDRQQLVPKLGASLQVNAPVPSAHAVLTVSSDVTREP